jgi:hypothetical protein
LLPLFDAVEISGRIRNLKPASVHFIKALRHSKNFHFCYVPMKSRVSNLFRCFVGCGPPFLGCGARLCLRNEAGLT